jgi:hypothetical protein
LLAVLGAQNVVDALPRKTGSLGNPTDRHAHFVGLDDSDPQFVSGIAARRFGSLPPPACLPDGLEQLGLIAHAAALSSSDSNMERPFCCRSL